VRLLPAKAKAVKDIQAEVERAERTLGVDQNGSVRASACVLRARVCVCVSVCVSECVALRCVAAVLDSINPHSHPSTPKHTHTHTHKPPTTTNATTTHHQPRTTYQKQNPAKALEEAADKLLRPAWQQTRWLSARLLQETVRKYMCLSACLSACLSVCLCVRACVLCRWVGTCLCLCLCLWGRGCYMGGWVGGWVWGACFLICDAPRVCDGFIEQCVAAI
jgi:hypothetical protein